MLVKKDELIQKYILKYIKEINGVYQRGNYTEYSFRSALKVFLENLMKITHPEDNYIIQEEHSHYENVNNYKGKTKNAPDYTISKGGLQTGVLETKRPEASLNNPNYQDQFSRYKKAFSFSIFTNYLVFHDWNGTKPGNRITIGQFGVNNNQNGIVESNDAVHEAKELADDIASANIQPIRSSRKLAIVTANLSKMLRNAVLNALMFYKYEKEHKNFIPNSLTYLYVNFKRVLIKDITRKAFSDLFAQTVTYGMIIARVTHPNGKFNRTLALKYIPSTDPFLKDFFTDVMGKNIDKKIKWLVERLATAFSVTDINCLTKGFGHDPLIHFYELFLKEFDNKMRKKLGVWYTPREIAKFIVGSVNYLLKSKLNLPNGLVSGLNRNDKIPVKINNRTKIEPRVQILDPAVGTGTFLLEALKLIYHDVKQKSNISGVWNKYVNNNLIYQLNAFEILMAAYTVAHLRLYISLRNTFNGHMPNNLKRFHVFLTNALTTPIKDNGNVFTPYIANEELASDKIKDKAPIMIIIGNPPYSRKSQNKESDVKKLMKPYVQGLSNRNQIAVHDDYVKFIRLAESYIEKRKLGIVGYITNSSYLRAKSCWKMRRHLASVFDDIYVINLNGGKYERPDTNSKHDENVFDIKIPVAISIFVKKSKKRVMFDDNHLAKIHYMNIVNDRIHKLKLLDTNSIKDFIDNGDFNSWTCSPKNNWSFIYEGDVDNSPYYNKFKPINKIFNRHTGTEGIVTGHDKLLRNNQSKTQDILNSLENDSKDAFYKNYGNYVNMNWISKAKKEIKSLKDFKVTRIQYRPLMYSYIPYSPLAKSNRVLTRPRNPTINNMTQGYDNLGLVVPSIINNSMSIFDNAIISNTLIVNRIFRGDRSGGFIFPLQAKSSFKHFTGNFSNAFISSFNKSINKSLDIHSYKDCRKILAWIIAILNAPQFIKKYNESLKNDFPRVPLPNNYKQFKELSVIGNDLINAFIVNYSSKELNQCPYSFINSNTDIKGNGWVVNKNILSKRYYDKQKCCLYINADYYFNDVKSSQIDFKLGGYNLIYQWLRDHSGKSLTLEDIKGMQGMLISISKIIYLRKKLESISFIDKF